jgi:antitoxin (DNA-binding transcriptional repressor) of toxin-antitoxin stability system
MPAAVASGGSGPCSRPSPMRGRLSQLLRPVRAGAKVVIAGDGEPVARLVPVAGAVGTLWQPQRADEN